MEVGRLLMRRRLLQVASIEESDTVNSNRRAMFFLYLSQLVFIIYHLFARSYEYKR